MGAPSALHGILTLCRVSNLPTVWTNVLAAALLSGPDAGPGSIVLLALSLSAFYCGGMCLNDIFDRDVDAVDQPFRPIPSGLVSVGRAQAVATGLFALGLALLAAAPHPSALLPGLALLGLIAAYDWLHKGQPWTVLLMAGCRTGVFVVTGQAVAGSVAPLVWLAGGVQFAYTLAVTVVARSENQRERRFSFPVIPVMIAGMSLVDGLLLAIFISPPWLLAGMAGAVLTRLGQRRVRGD